MSAVDLLQPLLDGGLQRNNFFNGRLLSAEDLRAEQTATDLQLGLIARAAGDGVAWGLGVSVLSAGAARPRVTVRAGLAINRLGNLLYLAEDAEVALVPSIPDTEAAAGLFRQCEDRLTSALTPEGAYVLVVSPTSGYRGTALVSDPNTTSAGRGSCGARFTVEGVRFRLVPMPLATLAGIGDALRAQVVALLPPVGVPSRERLRNLLAHLCFGTQALGFADPARRTAVQPDQVRWGAIDAMRARGDLTDCDVPLALAVLTRDGLSFADMWPARRRLVDAGAIGAWRGVAGPRRYAEGEAAFLQFQSQLAVVKGEASSTSIVASSYFDVLPAGGWLPAGTGGFDWRTFLGPHAPPAVTPVDGALLRGILERSWFDEPFALATDPPVPVRVFEVPEQSAGEAFVVFARSAHGNLRVVLSPAPADGETVDVTATAETGAVTRSTMRRNGIVIVPELAPGIHRVDVTAPDYVPVPPQEAAVVGGRTVDTAITLTPLPNGSILIDAIDKVTTASIGAAVNRITASDGTLSREGAFQQSSGRWLIEDLPAGSYTLTGTASHYKTAIKPSVGPTTRGQTINTQLIFEPQPQRRQPPLCVGVERTERPPLQRVRLCLVLAATEFEETYFYRDQPKLLAKAIVSSSQLRMAKRVESVKTQPSDRYVANTGEIIYNRPLWVGMIPLAPDLPQVREWLLLWREWFAAELEDPRIAKSNPVLYVDANYRSAIKAVDVRATPPAYAVFGRFGVPVSIQSNDWVTRGPVRVQKEFLPGVPDEMVRDLGDAQIYYFNDLAWGWTEIVSDATGEPEEMARYLIADAVTAVGTINEGRSYLPGVDKTTDKTLRDLGINDDVALANADLDKLADKVGGKGFALRLIESARQIAPASSWSLEGLGLSADQVHGLTMRGIDSKGAFVASAGRADGKAIIAEVTGLDAESAATRDAVVGSFVNGAVQAMTLSSLEAAPQPMLATWANVDSITAGKLGSAGITSVEDLASAKPEDVAMATNLSTEAAAQLVTDAKSASRSSLAVSALAPVTKTEEKNLKELLGTDATIGAISMKTADELAVAFGGNVGRATAVLAGIKVGLGTRGMIR